MNVLFLTTGYPRWRGDICHTYLHGLARTLAKRGAQIHVVAPHAKGLPKEEWIDGVYIHRFQYLYPACSQRLAYLPGIPEIIKTVGGKLQLPFLMISMTKKFLESIRRYNPSVIVAHWALPAGLIASFTKRIHRRPVVVKIYGAEIFALSRRNNILSKIARQIIKSTLRSVEKIVSNSSYTCNVAREISGREDIETILPEGVDLEHFKPSHNYLDLQKRYDLNDSYVVFSTGRMVERKGFRYLVEAMPYVSKRIRKTKLIIGGDGPERKSLEKICSDLGIEDNVVFPGFLSDENLPKLMNLCTVFVLPSIVDRRWDTEGLGLVLLEAMACGKPVIGTNVGGISQIIQNGKNGFILEQKNPQQIARLIIKLLQSPSLMKTIGEYGRKYVELNFDWDLIAEKWMQILSRENERG